MCDKNRSGNRNLIERNWNEEQNVVVQFARIRTYIKSLLELLYGIILYNSQDNDLKCLIFPVSPKGSP